MSDSLALFTAIKNERPHVEGLVENVLQLTRRPALWVIVDGGSTDGTFEWLEAFAASHGWVRVHRQQVRHPEGYGHRNFAMQINEAIQAIASEENRLGSKFSHWGKIDATVRVEPDYFEKLRKQLLQPQTSFSCGVQVVVTGTQRTRVAPNDSISGDRLNDIRLYRREFLLSQRGYPVTPAPDAILALRARKSDQPPTVVADATFLKLRHGGAKDGWWKGGELKGRMMYQLGYHPILALGNAAAASLRLKPHLQLLPMATGYLRAWLRSELRVPDPDIREYYGRERLRELLRTARAKEPKA